MDWSDLALDRCKRQTLVNPVTPELNPICYLLLTIFSTLAG